jgi:hypothetical protein
LCYFALKNAEKPTEEAIFIWLFFFGKQKFQKKE